MKEAIVGYLRVSTQKQGKSGLGLDAQREAVAGYAAGQGMKVIGWYTDIESGKNPDRPELARAFCHAGRSKATLCVAKLSRIARSVEMVARSLNSQVRVVACDNPYAEKLTLHVLAAVDENYAKQLSENTKAALQALKARGTLLGSARPGHWDGREDARRKGGLKGTKAAAKKRQREAAEAYTDLQPTLATLQVEGLSLRGIAARLNAEGHTTRQGKPWNPVQVSRVLERAKE